MNFNLKLLIFTALVAACHADLIDAMLYKKMQTCAPKLTNAQLFRHLALGVSSGGNTYSTTVDRSQLDNMTKFEFQFRLTNRLLGFGSKFKKAFKKAGNSIKGAAHKAGNGIKGTGKHVAAKSGLMNRIRNKVAANRAANGPAMPHKVFPFEFAGALKWGTKVEYLETQKHVSGNGGNSWAIVVGAIGSRKGEKVNLVSVQGWAATSTRQQNNVISYKKCKRIFFIKKCNNVNENVPRGLNNDELQVMVDGLLNSASSSGLNKLGEAVKKDAEQLAQSSGEVKFSGNQSESIKLRGVQKEHLVEAIGSMAPGSKACEGQAQDFAKNPRSGSFKQGKFEVKLNWVGNQFEVTILF